MANTPVSKPKTAAKPASKPAQTKPTAAKTAVSKPTVSKPIPNQPVAAKPAAIVAKPVVTKPAATKSVVAKPATPVKAAVKPIAKTATKAKPATKAKAADSKKDHKKDDKKNKPEKVKMERDSFTMPKEEYAAIGTLKSRMNALGHPVKKSELLRAGIKLLAAMSDNTLKMTMEKIPVIKTGRPKK